MAVVGKYRYDLILVSECCDQRANGFAVAQVIKQFELILYPGRAASDIYLLDCNISSMLSAGRALPALWYLVICVHIPVVDMSVIFQVFGFINGREGALESEWPELR